MSNQSTQDDRNIPPPLIAEVSAQSARSVPREFALFAEALRSRFGEALDAVILYGSCLHMHDPAEGVVDLYAIVDDYRNAYGKRRLQLFNAWLPPNVFYLEVEGEGTKLRAKYAVISRRDFEHGCRGWFHSYIWARFAQPVRLLHVRDEAARKRVNQSLATAVLTFLKTTIPASEPDEVYVEDIWARGLSLTYASELRPEKKDRARKLARVNLSDYDRLTRVAAPALAGRLRSLPGGGFRCVVNKREHRRAKIKWWLRGVQGRILSVLRLIKAAFTFNHCIEYAAWKIKRHTGVTVDVTPRLQRHPILWGSSMLWQLLRRGVLR